MHDVRVYAVEMNIYAIRLYVCLCILLLALHEVRARSTILCMHGVHMLRAAAAVAAAAAAVCVGVTTRCTSGHTETDGITRHTHALFVQHTRAHG